MKWSIDKILIGLLIVIGVVLFFSYSTTGFSENHKLSCSADVSSNLGLVYLGNVKCVEVQQGCFKNPLKSVTGYSLLSSEGQIKFDAGDDFVVESFSVSKLFGSKTYSSNLCSTKNDVLVSVFNDKGNLVTSKSVRSI